MKQQTTAVLLAHANFVRSAAELIRRSTWLRQQAPIAKGFTKYLQSRDVSNGTRSMTIKLAILSPGVFFPVSHRGATEVYQLVKLNGIFCKCERKMREHGN